MASTTGAKAMVEASKRTGKKLTVGYRVGIVQILVPQNYIDDGGLGGLLR